MSKKDQENLNSLIDAWTAEYAAKYPELSSPEQLSALAAVVGDISMRTTSAVRYFMGEMMFEAVSTMYNENMFKMPFSKEIMEHIAKNPEAALRMLITLVQHDASMTVKDLGEGRIPPIFNAIGQGADRLYNYAKAMTTGGNTEIPTPAATSKKPSGLN